MNIDSVYVLTDSVGNITNINSSAFLTDLTGWTLIDEGCGDKYHHAQGNYLDKPIMTLQGVWRYKLIEGAPVEKTPLEIAAEESALPLPAPSDSEQIALLKAENATLIAAIDSIMTETIPTIMGLFLQ